MIDRTPLPRDRFSPQPSTSCFLVLALRTFRHTPYAIRRYLSNKAVTQLDGKMSRSIRPRLHLAPIAGDARDAFWQCISSFISVPLPHPYD